MKFNKEYEEWNRLMKILDEIDFLLPYNEREIWWISFGINVGMEIDGKGEEFERPAIVIKKYNREHAWIIHSAARLS